MILKNWEFSPSIQKDIPVEFKKISVLGVNAKMELVLKHHKTTLESNLV
jgi:hypothetical protein